MKFAMGQLAVLHKCHSALDYFNSLTWDNNDRIKTLVVAIMKLEGTEYQTAIIAKHLVASVRRVRLPGAKYDMCPLLISQEGWNKSTFLQILYGRRNVLTEDILDLTSKDNQKRCAMASCASNLPTLWATTGGLRREKSRVFCQGRTMLAEMPMAALRM